jgi:hypothetical protein
MDTIITYTETYFYREIKRRRPVYVSFLNIWPRDRTGGKCV